MPDVFTKKKRSAVMSLIRSHGNRDTELRLIAIMRAHRITGWRRNWPLFGKPDFAFPKLKLAVFVDGCFWPGPPSPRPRRGNLPAPRHLAPTKRRLLAQMRGGLVRPPPGSFARLPIAPGGRT